MDSIYLDDVKVSDAKIGQWPQKGARDNNSSKCEEYKEKWQLRVNCCSAAILHKRYQK